MNKASTVFLGVGFIACVVTSSHASEYRDERIVLQSGPTQIEVISTYTLVEGANLDRYSIKNLFDGDKATAWVTKFDKKSTYRDDGLFKIVFETPVFVRSVRVMNGCQKSARLFSANQRVKTLNVEKVIVGGRSFPLEATVSLMDSLGEQEISLHRGWTQSVNLFKTKELIFNVFDIYEGAKYQDLCISEMKVSYSKGNEYSPSVSWEELQKLIDENSVTKNDGWDWGGLTRRNFQLFNDFLHYVLTGNKDAYARFSTYVPEGTAQAEAMSNIYRKAVEESLALDAARKSNK